MSFTTEQPSSFDFEECCICAEEFSNDTDLAAHLLEHAEESMYNANNEDNSYDSDVATQNNPVTPAKENFPEYTRTNLNQPQSVPKNSANRSASPEVFEINSDDSGDEKTALPKPPPQQPQPQQRHYRLSNGPANVPFHNGQMRRSVGRPAAVQQVSAPKQLSQMTPPFNCNTCSSAFTDPKLFRDHLLTHEKPKPYSCNICNKTFAYKGTLRQHLKLHLGEKLHECPRCHKRFTIKAVLKKHCEEMHGIYNTT